MESSSPGSTPLEQKPEDADARPARTKKRRIQIVDVTDQKPSAIAFIGGVRLPADDAEEKGADK